MKSFVPVVAVVAALISACASVPNEQSTPYGYGVDERAVTNLNVAAKASGLEVHWINYPQARPKTIGAVAPPTEPSGS